MSAPPKTFCEVSLIHALLSLPVLSKPFKIITRLALNVSNVYAPGGACGVGGVTGYDTGTAC